MKRCKTRILSELITSSQYYLTFMFNSTDQSINPVSPGATISSISTLFRDKLENIKSHWFSLETTNQGLVETISHMRPTSRPLDIIPTKFLLNILDTGLLWLWALLVIWLLPVFPCFQICVHSVFRFVSFCFLFYFEILISPLCFCSIYFLPLCVSLHLCCLDLFHLFVLCHLSLVCHQFGLYLSRVARCLCCFVSVVLMLFFLCCFSWTVWLLPFVSCWVFFCVVVFFIAPPALLWHFGSTWSLHKPWLQSCFIYSSFTFGCVPDYFKNNIIQSHLLITYLVR